MAGAAQENNKKGVNGATRTTSFGVSNGNGKVIDSIDGKAGFNPSLERNSKQLASPTEGMTALYSHVNAVGVQFSERISLCEYRGRANSPHAATGNYPSWTPGKGEKKTHYVLRVLTEGHTVTDGKTSVLKKLLVLPT